MKRNRSRSVNIDTWVIHIGVQCPDGEECTAIVVAIDDTIDNIMHAKSYYARGEGSTAPVAVSEALHSLASKIFEENNPKNTNPLAPDREREP